MQRPKQLTVIVCSLLLTSAPFSAAQAYVGPGVGVTMLGTFWAVVSMVGVFVGGMLIWPIRSFLRRKKTVSDNEKKS